MKLLRIVFAGAIAIIAGDRALAGSKGLIDTTKSPSAQMYMVDLSDVKWTGGLWGDRFEVCRKTMIPHMWEIFQSERDSHTWANFQIAAGVGTGRDGKYHGPPFADGDFLKWFEGLAQVYAVTHDPEVDKLMDQIIPVLVKAQREDGYLSTRTIIPQRQGDPQAKEFENREHFETYNMGHLMTAACVHYRATGKTTMLDMAKKAADYLDDFCKRAPAELAKNAICPSHYMGVVEMYRVTGEAKYLELSKRLIDIRSDVQNGTDQNQDRIPVRQMTRAVGHAVRANYLYAGVADVVAETGDQTLLKPLTTIARDVATHKLYITGATGALYDGASPDGSGNNGGIQLVHQAYGRDYELPNLTAYNESCATIGYALWNWRMLEITGDAHYADLFEQSLYNGVLPCISLEGKDYFYVNPLKKMGEMTWPLRWSRSRQPNIQSSFCCPPNVVRTIAEAQNYIYSLSKDAIWVNLYGGSTLNTTWTDGGQIKLRQETDYPWNGAIKMTIDAAPDRPIAMKLRIPGWSRDGQTSIRINGQPIDGKLVPGSYFELKRAWKVNDVVELNINFSPVLVEANPLVEEVLNQVAVRCGPLVYCVESADLPPNVKVADVALDSKNRQFTASREKIAGAEVVTLNTSALQLARMREGSELLYQELPSAPPAPIQIKLVPYYAWGNRGNGDMTIWLPVR